MLLIFTEAKHNSNDFTSISISEEIHFLLTAIKTPPPLVDELDNNDLSHL